MPHNTPSGILWGSDGGIPANQSYVWTNSLVVLSWLQGNPHRFKTFVGDRVLEIIKLHVTVPTCWRCVNSADCRADCASRCLFPAKLAQHYIWWYGPDWLWEPESNWLPSPDLDCRPESNEA